MTKRLTISILALIISSAIFLASCEYESQKLSESESPGETSAATESSESVSDSEDISTETPEPTAGTTSEDVSIDFSDALAIPDGFKGHRMGEALALIDFERGFGAEFSAEDGLFSNLHFRLYAKGDSCYADINMVALNAVILATGDKSYILDHKTKKYQKANGTAEDIRHIFQLMDIANENIAYVGTIEKDIDGVTYIVEQYKEADESDVSLECYFKDEKLAMCNDGQLVKINITDNIPEDIFEIPDGYSELKPEDIIAVPDDYKDLAIGKALSRFNGEDGFAITLKATATSIDGSILSTTTTTTSIKGDKVKTDKRYVSEALDTTYTNLYLDGKMYQLNHMQRSYVTYEERFLLPGERLFDVLEYKRTETEAIGDVSYTVDIFRITSMGMVTADKDCEVKFYTIDGIWKYLSCDVDLTGRPMPCAPLLCFRGLADVDIAVLGDADEIFRIPDEYIHIIY